MQMDLVNCSMDRENCSLHYLQLTPVFSHEECVYRVTYALKEIVMKNCFAQNGNYKSEDISGNKFFINNSSVTQEKSKKIQ